MQVAAHDLRQWLATQGVLDPAEHLRLTLGFPQASALAPARNADPAVLPGVRKGSATALIGEALEWFRQKFAKAS
jgi:hypothetical protein